MSRSKRVLVAAQQDVWVAFEDASGSAWEVDVETSSADVVARYRDEVARANDVISSTPMDAAPVTWPEEMFGEFRLPDLTSILLHVITETACQAGHLDAAREILDGRQWVVLSLQPQRRSSNVLPTGPSCCRSKTVRPSASARIRPTGMVIRPSPIAWRTWCRRRRRSRVATIIPP